ncbi:phospholipid-translocating ATPase [Blastomyces gilchristii SLH14081]|uniref:Phospholipid-transporting ATPase n=1 Tax=Blastomyces gilchristii (strain SLH14081) TaxID=559298 RepID=A0A179USX7_BLAGS|nr:phospholipid-translocating ATPase [Blastomyces gilchristii SLH14081]OAT11225.1 phospholipid-translocating ATPase [Blastomyces gilchristii SLH14081]
MAGRDGNNPGLGRLDSPRLPRRASSRSPLRDSILREGGADREEDGTVLLQDAGGGRTTGDAGDIGASTHTDTTDRASSQDTRRPSQARVRFSVDLERTPDNTIPPSPRCEESQDSAGRDVGGGSGRAAGLGLRVDTSLPSVISKQRSPSLRSSGQWISPVSPVSPTDHLPPLHESPPLVLPATRNRGYSLRRAIFNRNIANQSEHDQTDNIELRHQLSAGGEPLSRVHSQPQIQHGAGQEVVFHTSSKDEESTTFSDLKAQLRERKPYSAGRAAACKVRATHELAVGKLKVVTDAFRKHVLRIKEIPPSKDGRHIDLDVQRQEPRIDERTGKYYVSNHIRSSRYSLWSFFPRQLVAQFSKLANFYFLVVSILQMIPGLSTTGTFTTFVPLMIFVGISMGKEGIDDLRRYRLDKEENNRIAYILRARNANSNATAATTATTSKTTSTTSTDAMEAKITSTTDTDSYSNSAGYWAPTKWVDIKVGDVIKLSRDQPAPADIVLLHADDPNGIAYIETMALDGETNLKSKQPCRPVAKTCKTAEDIIHNTSIHFAVEDPNIDLYKFDGNVTVGQEKLPITNSEVIYRGSILRNTHEAFGMVIYTGEECKIRMNANKNPRIKAPALQTVVNRVVAVIVLFVVVLASACTIAYTFWSRDVEDKSWYLEEADVSIGPIFTSFIIMFNTMIPISLYVSLEIVKVAQIFLLNDIDMYDVESDTPLEARTSTINEELGQVSYIFSDKTGTLTNNSMKFRKMSVAGTAWLHDTDLQEEAARDADRKMLLHKKRKEKKASSRKSSTYDQVTFGRKSGVSNHRQEENSSPTATTTTHWRSNRRGRMYHGGRTVEMLEYIQQKPHTLFARRAKFFILALALCHTCIPERDDDGDISFQAASPDEAALVTAAKEMGYLVVDRQPNSLTIRLSTTAQDEDGEPVAEEEVYEILDIIEFSSVRKRMSIVVRMPDQRICLFCKGADSTVMGLLKRSGLAAEKVAEIENRANKRKSLEAKEVMRRNSEHAHRKDGKTSMSIGRPSFAAGRRSSVSGKRRSSLRDSIDVWLRDRETDGGLELRDGDDDYYYSPRPSMQLSPRPSGALSEERYRASFQTDDGAEDLVEESLVVNEAMVFERCFQHLNDFATEGLRTLLYGYRFIEEADYQEWKARYHEATTSLVGRQEKIEQVGEQIETQLELGGATAIEDKLQKGVPEAIDKLRRANIKLWMLTGDKRETAINIGNSCRLVKDYSTVTILDHDAGDVERVILETTSEIVRGACAHSVIVVDGQTLSTVEADAPLQELFFDLAILADSVICCRASPKQKAFLVRSIRKRVKRSITLAIGDGANDIAMIQEAHVGIGITGKEGLQAARISDYSIAQFRFLLKLLLVHGRWNYIRVCKYTLGTFWKETVFYLTQALYQRWNGYTGTSLYESWSLSMFNTLFTSLPVIFLGIFEKDLAASTLLAVPELYTKGQRNGGFNVKLYLGWAFMGSCEAMVVYFTMYGLFGSAIFTLDNRVFAMGLLTYTACVIIINLKLQFLEIRYRTVMAAIVIIVSIGGWFLWNIILSRRYALDAIYNVRDNFLPRTGRNLLWWVTLLLAVVAVLLFEICVTTLRVALFPTDVDHFQEFEGDLEIRKRFEEAAASELQQGWDRGKKSGLETMTDLNGGDVADMEAEREREMQVQELLDRRSAPRGRGKGKGGDGADVQMEEVELGNGQAFVNGGGGGAGRAAEESGDVSSPSPSRRSLDIQELLNRRFGAIWKGQL